ncbi:MAG: hypothetical protein MI807_01320 [Verrucomicrobiales bacterium]|nr:hypothetical protein [Verrucomicrobiales bacterium]
MPVMLRLILFDRQAGYFYINGAWLKFWQPSVSHRPLIAFNDALICLS